MGTWGSDAAYMLLRPGPDSLHVDKREIVRRWEKVKPWALREARLGLANPATKMLFFKDIHAERYLRLRRSGITVKQIRMGYLDDPTTPTARFQDVLNMAIQRHKDRMGRVKGRGKKYGRTDV